jgi:hypothetical protein
MAFIIQLAPKTVLRQCDQYHKIWQYLFHIEAEENLVNCKIAVVLGDIRNLNV